MTQTEDAKPFSHILRVADLTANETTAFELVLTPDQCAAIAADIDLPALRKVRFTGSLSPMGKRDWKLTGHLGATVTQDCVVTLAPVTTRIEEDVTRQWIAGLVVAPEGDEVEMPEDVTQEKLGDVIDLGDVLVEALALALPLYPRAEDAALPAQNFAEPGVTPMTDEAARPFAGLADLRSKLAKGKEGESDESDS
ncbi:YceD family protein [Aliiroseovarius crassostreae]|uniref:YceD family protein n=1 Tax=Aliiroseovarius crassostreae TaxID=154981 RepID=UPI003C7B2E1B